MEVLSLADNYISSLEDLSGLARLRDLNAARNDVARAGGALGACAALTRLNLAANRVASFQVRAGAARGGRPTASKHL